MAACFGLGKTEKVSPMKTQILDSPAKRISIAVAVLTGLILVAAAAYTFLGSSASKPVNGLKIIAAARAYHSLPATRAFAHSASRSASTLD